MSESDQPLRVSLSVEDERVRRRIRELLAHDAFDLEVLKSARALLEGRRGADVVVVDRDRLEAGGDELLEEARDDESAPGVIVVGQDVDDTERAALIAAGATGVVDPLEHADRLLALTRAEAAGGLDGPEVGGAEAQPLLADFASRNAAMKEFVELVHRVADTEATLLIGGETGVGKERLARAIHNESRRRDGPFVAVNCGALPENLLESELFGHEKGAFTGADSVRAGRFESASGGTIFLDEIGELPTHLQVNLLTVLQRHEVRRVGGERALPVDVRVMAATNRDLVADVQAGRFREDLFFRLNVVALEIPPLRDRPEDIADLTGTIFKHFRQSGARTSVEGLSSGAVRALTSYAWPGNVRELTNVIERALLLARGPELSLPDLPAHVREGAPLIDVRDDDRSPAPAAGAPDLDLPLAEARRRVVTAFERAYLTGLLERHAGHVGRTAQAAGINPRTLYEKMRKHGLDKADFRPSNP